MYIVEAMNDDYRVRVRTFCGDEKVKCVEYGCRFMGGYWEVNMLDLKLRM